MATAAMQRLMGRGPSGGLSRYEEKGEVKMGLEEALRTLEQGSSNVVVDTTPIPKIPLGSKLGLVLTFKAACVINTQYLATLKKRGILNDVIFYIMAPIKIEGGQNNDSLMKAYEEMSIRAEDSVLGHRVVGNILVKKVNCLLSMTKDSDLFFSKIIKKKSPNSHILCGELPEMRPYKDPLEYQKEHQKILFNALSCIKPSKDDRNMKNEEDKKRELDFLSKFDLESSSKRYIIADMNSINVFKIALCEIHRRKKAGTEREMITLSA